MAIVAESFATNTITAQSITINKPSGTADGDVLVAFVAVTSLNVTFSAPAGWTQVEHNNTAGNGTTAMFYRVASSEGASYDFSISGGVNGLMSGGITRFSGVNTSTPSDATATKNSGSSQYPRGLSITTASDNAMLVMGNAWASAGQNSSSAPTGMSETWEVARNCQYNGTQATAGASGDKDATMSASAVWNTILWALKPAAAGGDPEGSLIGGKLLRGGLLIHGVLVRG